jgi:ABC-2 type transport system permease protein
MGILLIEFIYGSVDSIAGWNKHEMIILICTSQIVNQFYRGIIHWNQNRFISSVSNGGFDRMLLRPVSIMFQANTGNVDFTCPISALCPLIVLIIQINSQGINISGMSVLLYILYVINGVIILSSFMLLLYTSAFIFTKADGLTNLYYLMMDIADRPKEMFSREFMYGFILIIPAIPLANAPASALLGKADVPMMLIYLFIGAAFLPASYMAMKAGLKKYTSASS